MSRKVHDFVQNPDDFYTMRSFTKKYDVLAFVETVGFVGEVVALSSMRGICCKQVHSFDQLREIFFALSAAPILFGKDADVLQIALGFR